MTMRHRARFADEQRRLADAARQAEVRFFSIGRREEALQWLRAR
jgi:hypothetical protein